MNTRTSNRIFVGSLALAVMAGAACSPPGPAAVLVLAATIDRDCGPADGPAFTLSIPVDAGGVAQVSIWRAPDTWRWMSYQFPDQEGQVGTATYRTEAGAFEQLAGSVSVGPVRVGNPVEGEMRLTSRSGDTLAGRFRAEWGRTTAFCG
jgi:hypothetical protein